MLDNFTAVFNKYADLILKQERCYRIRSKGVLEREYYHSPLRITTQYKCRRTTCSTS